MVYKTFIIQEDCTACGQCEQDVPELYRMWNSGPLSDGLAYVKNASDRTGMGEDGTPRLKGVEGLAVIPDRLLEDVVFLSEECPGDCLMICLDEEC